MKLITYLKDAYEIIPDCAVALGNFDGLHIGHQALIRECIRLAEENDLASVVFSFQELPLNVICGPGSVKHIMTLEEKIKACEVLGVDYMVCVPFDESIRIQSPERFVKHLLHFGLKAKIAVCGYNYSFGTGGKGRAEDLVRIGSENGISVKVIPEVKVDENSVSSSLIRECLREGRIYELNQYLGRKYSLSGIVSEGKKLGTDLGFPTANLRLDESLELPKKGVYATKTAIDGKEYQSVTNIGTKPTIGTFGINAETHIIGFSEPLYGKEIMVYFERFLRDEKKFADLAELKAQITADVESVSEHIDEFSS